VEIKVGMRIRSTLTGQREGGEIDKGFVFLATLSTDGPEIVMKHPDEVLNEEIQEKISLGSFTMSSGGGEYVSFRIGDFEVFTATFTLKRSTRNMVMSLGVASKGSISLEVKRKIKELVKKVNGGDYSHKLAEIVREMPEIYKML